MKKITVVFPMAGEGQRFGNKFKPFLKIFDKTFIELAVEPFLKHKNEIEKIYFIVRNDHFKDFNVDEKIKSLKMGIPTSVVPIHPTKSPIETVSSAGVPMHDVIFCDCDHSLNVDAVFKAIREDKYDCIIPGWEEITDVKKWSIAVTNNGAVSAVSEKKYPAAKGKAYGVIGCYYFKNIDFNIANFSYISEIVNYMVENHKAVKLVPIREAEFFGDPERLQNLYIAKNACTIFCDLDGTIIRHENVPDYTKGIELLEGSREKIEEWRKNNAFIVLTTARDEQFRPDMERMLREAGVRYEYLVMGLPPGPRYLINDKKPYADKAMAKSIEVMRDEGIRHIHIGPSEAFILNIGHSEASLSKIGATFSKKLPEGASDYQKAKFKSQYDSLFEIGNTFKDFVPAVLDYSGTSYSMEFLGGYKAFHQLSKTDRAMLLREVFNKLSALYKAKVKSDAGWLAAFMKDKIFSKEPVVAGFNLGDTQKLIKLFQSVSAEKLKEVSPQYLCRYIHGDLTYENILVKDSGVRFIDLDNDNKSGPPELDLGKLTQSILAQYEHWDDKEFDAGNKDEFDIVTEFYSGLLNQPVAQTKNKAYFYCAIHLFRMIPYQFKRSPHRAKMAFDFCVDYLKMIK